MAERLWSREVDIIHPWEMYFGCLRSASYSQLVTRNMPVPEWLQLLLRQLLGRKPALSQMITGSTDDNHLMVSNQPSNSGRTASKSTYFTRCSDPVLRMGEFATSRHLVVETL